MKVTVRLFASFREASGQPQTVVEVAPGATVGQLWQQLVDSYPRLRPLNRYAMFALNGRYATADAPLSEGDVVAFLPPVSGG